MNPPVLVLIQPGCGDPWDTVIPSLLVLGDGRAGASPSSHVLLPLHWEQMEEHCFFLRLQQVVEWSWRSLPVWDERS